MSRPRIKGGAWQEKAWTGAFEELKRVVKP